MNKMVCSPLSCFNQIIGVLFACFFLNTSYSYNTITISDNIKQPRYAKGIVSIIQDHSYLRKHKAPFYWKISPYYLPQLTDSSCSIATATMVINALRIPQMRYANQKLATSASVESINNAWANDVKQGGRGVTLDQLGAFLTQALKTYNIDPVKVEVIHATSVKDIATKFHQALIAAETTGRISIIINFEQQFISGTEKVGHFAPVGAYDITTKRLLIMDPDREFFEPYWVSEHQILNSMATEDSETHRNRGFIIVKTN